MTGSSTITLDEALDRFLRAKKIEGCTQKTLQAYQYEISRYIDFVQKTPNHSPDLSLLEQDRVEEWLADRDMETATRARILASLKSLSRFLKDRKFLDHNPLESLKTPRIKAKNISFLQEDEFVQLMEIASKAKGARTIPGRDYAILALFIGSGIRISELAGLHLKHLDMKNRVIQITRKGGKGQIVPFGDSVHQALQDWLIARSDLKLDEKETALFISLRRRPMSIQTIRDVVKKYMKQAGLWGKKMSPHTLRHSYATAQIASGTPVQVVQELMGHNQLNTTSKYLHIVDEDRKKAAEKIKF